MGSKHSGPRRRILIIEDHRDAAESLRDLLELAGHSVEVAFSGNRGLEVARESQPDVILCDLGLPDLNGLQFAQAIRAEPALWTTRLIAVSGHVQPREVERALAAGFNVHLAKPPDVERLLRLLYV